jgi:serine/threonine protein kinase
VPTANSVSKSLCVFVDVTIESPGTCTIEGETYKVAFKDHRRLQGSRVSQIDLNRTLTEFRHEIKLMKRLDDHPNVVQIIGVTFRANVPILLVEFGDLTLENHLYSTTVGWPEKIKLCLDIVDGIEGLHAANIIHGDLKGSNIILFMNANNIPTAKITDFGFSSTLTSSAGMLCSF